MLISHRFSAAPLGHEEAAEEMLNILSKYLKFLLSLKSNTRAKFT